jgi:hypothetical protein
MTKLNDILRNDQDTVSKTSIPQTTTTIQQTLRSSSSIRNQVEENPTQH